jgi:hypothetical protein
MEGRPDVRGVAQPSGPRARPDRSGDGSLRDGLGAGGESDPGRSPERLVLATEPRRRRGSSSFAGSGCTRRAHRRERVESFRRSSRSRRLPFPQGRSSRGWESRSPAGRVPLEPLLYGLGVMGLWRDRAGARQDSEPSAIEPRDWADVSMRAPGTGASRPVARGRLPLLACSSSRSTPILFTCAIHRPRHHALRPAAGERGSRSWSTQRGPVWWNDVAGGRPLSANPNAGSSTAASAVSRCLAFSGRGRLFPCSTGSWRRGASGAVASRGPLAVGGVGRPQPRSRGDRLRSFATSSRERA